MQSNAVLPELLALREEIDKLDEDILAILAKRFVVTNSVGKLKAEKQLSSVDSTREADKLTRLKALAEGESLNSEFVLDLFQTIFNEVVKNHRTYLK